MSRNQKKQKFTEPQKSNTGIFVLIGVLAVVVIGLGAYFFAGGSSNPNAALNVGSGSFVGQNLEFAKITAGEADGYVTVNLDELKDKKAITFDVQGVNFSLANGTPFNYLPLLGYVSPKGDVVVAVSLCEPCSGINFRTQGDELYCKACGTTWTLDGLKGTGGGCQTYPPETIKYEVDGSTLKIKKADLTNWKPRPV